MVDTLRINDVLEIPLDELEFRAIRSRGAGGQNVNKVSSAIQLRFDFARSDTLPARVRERLQSLDDQRVTAQGIVIKAQEFRRQSQNRAAALDRLKAMIIDALEEPKPRIATKPSRQAKRARVTEKRRQAERKRNRQRPPID
ncbi:MAG: alternative ribosome rescue aminoacyl-tRNA hydrolase ArfB [Pseudomonadota bacterium]